MGHPLSAELRKLAESSIALGGTKDTLRRAADALDALTAPDSPHDLIQQNDELLRQVKEGDELRQEYLDDWQKEVDELRRQLDAMTKVARVQDEKAHHWLERMKPLEKRAERAEAQAARYRGALLEIVRLETYDVVGRGLADVARRALGEPEKDCWSPQAGDRWKDHGEPDDMGFDCHPEPDGIDEKRDNTARELANDLSLDKFDRFEREEEP